jgi:hypothetical protein
MTLGCINLSHKMMHASSHNIESYPAFGRHCQHGWVYNTRDASTALPCVVDPPVLAMSADSGPNHTRMSVIRCDRHSATRAATLIRAGAASKIVGHR